jgi:hypothetical protein
MVQRKMRMFVAAVATFFMFSDIAAAMPIASMNDSGGISPIFVRGGRGGGGARAGGFHGGGARGFHGGGARVHHGGVAVRGGAYRGAAVRGGVYRGAAVRGGVYRGAAVRGAWGRGYRWPAGGAIAAGAAVGFLTAGAAAAYATTRAPAAGLCWYYTDASRSSGFWDTCP